MLRGDGLLITHLDCGVGFWMYTHANAYQITHFKCVRLIVCPLGQLSCSKRSSELYAYDPCLSILIFMIIPFYFTL